MLYVPQMNFFSTSILEHECMEKKSELHKGNLKRFSYIFIHVVPNQNCCKEVELGELSSNLSTFLDFGSGPSPRSDWRGFLQWVGRAWAMYGFVRACPKPLFCGDFQLTSKLKTNRSTSHGSEYCLCIGVLGMEQRKSRFRNLKWVDGTTQEFVSGTFRGWQFQVCLLAISVNSGSCSHINFVQTAVEDKGILCCVLVSPLERR